MSTMKRHLGTALLATLATATLQQAHANAPVMDVPIGALEGQPAWSARQSSDLRDDTGADVALPAGPGEVGLFIVPDVSTPSYTKRQLNPWWQSDLRVRRDITTVAALPCEGHATSTPVVQGVNQTVPPRIACNGDYDLSDAWVLVSDLPFPNDPWLASVAGDSAALISRFPIISNGYTQPQVASINRSGRYLRIQFPPNTHRAMAIEALSIRGLDGISDATLNLHDAHDALFIETRLLIDSLAGFQDVAGFTDSEITRLHGRGRQLERAARSSASVARRVGRIDSNLTSVVRLLRKAEVISQLRGPARVTRTTLERLRPASRQLSQSARQAEGRLRNAQRKIRKLNTRVRQSQGVLSAGIAWSASEATAVSGAYHSHVADVDNPTVVVLQPQPEQLEGYSGFRNDQIELAMLNERTQDIGDAVKTFNDAVQRGEDSLAGVQQRLDQADQQLARIETTLDALTRPLREIDSVLGRRVCVPATRICLSVNDVLAAIEDGKNLIGLGALEKLAYDLLDPVINEITRPLTAAFPSLPTFPTIIDIDLPDTSLIDGQLTALEETIASLRDLLQTPSFFNMSEASAVIEQTRETDRLWQELNERAGDEPLVSL